MQMSAAFERMFGRWGALVSLLLVTLGFALSAGPAQAVPSFARQTGQPCAACHTAFPELTAFGRRFKLNGYTLEGGDSKLPPVALMIIPGFTHTQAAFDPGTQPGGLKTNDNVVTQQITGLYAGKVYGNLGAFIQVSGSPLTGQVWFDASDVRYADTFKLFGKDATWGISVNNTPTVQDVWNTTNAWSWPQVSSAVQPFLQPGTHIDSLAQQVAGVGAYVFWNDMVYAELTGYGGYNKNTLEAFGMIPGPTPDVQQGLIPYWRLAVEPHWGDHYLELGTFGLYGQTIPGGLTGVGADQYTDIGFDAQYQYDGDPYSVTVKLTDIIEYQKLNATFATGGSDGVNNKLNSFKGNVTFVWDHTYSLGAGYFAVNGTQNYLLNPGSVVGSPNTRGLVFDVAYLPFSHGSPWPYSTYNARIGLQYINYLQVQGGTTNFDGAGPGGMHNASGNNTLFAYAWLAF